MRAGANARFQGKRGMGQAWVTTLSFSVRGDTTEENLGPGEGTCIRTLFLYNVVTFSLFTPCPQTQDSAK